jgi:ribonucleotide monophosphatase NagD (HAD superfamily)
MNKLPQHCDYSMKHSRVMSARIPFRWQSACYGRSRSGRYLGSLTKALVFGKPAKPFFQAAVEKLGLPAGQVVMIGDDIEADVGGAKRAGLKGALVKTGKFRPADLEGSIKPDIVFPSVADLSRWWDGQGT